MAGVNNLRKKCNRISYLYSTKLTLTQKHAYIQFANKILNFKSNGINMIKGRTSACLAGSFLAVEDHSKTQGDRRNPTKETKKTDKNDEHRKDSKNKVNQNP